MPLAPSQAPNSRRWADFREVTSSPLVEQADFGLLPEVSAEFSTR
jgi:hypothetical protein